VVVRERDGRYEVAVIKPAGRNVTALPKGHIDPGEAAAQAAQREVLEETGLTARLEAKLGDVKYFFKWQGQSIFKVVSFFLFRFESGEIDALEPKMREEVEVARWLSLDEAPRTLTYRGEKQMAQKAIEALHGPAAENAKRRHP
jgi:8-oxo-dGTP pyrophosphatase MutT (NUDIX family)